MSDELPPLWALDMAAQAANYTNWAEVAQMYGGRISRVYASVEAHARTLAKYEKPPVDEAELKRRQDARDAAGQAYENDGSILCASFARSANKDTSTVVQSAYLMACLKDGVTPTPVSEWSDK